MSNYPYVLTPPMDSPDSNMLSPLSGNESPNNTYIPQGICPPAFHMGIPHMQSQGLTPFLKIVEEPVERFRFRYKSEMAGTHGSLTGRNSDRSRKQTYPTVELYNYDKPATIRCSLYQYSKEETARSRQPHAHRLVKKQGMDELDDPHDLPVNPDNGYVAIFHSMGIIHTAKKYIVAELEKKNKKLKLEDVARKEGQCRPLSKKEEQEVKTAVEKESKSINLNIVCLRFDAFEVRDGIYYPICPPIYSTSINNLKSALTGDLKIVRMDHFTSPSKGGKEIFILVEKVTKKNIKVRFYELDDEDNEIWSDYGKFTDLDVHHQYAIVFKTPPYKVLDIDAEVKVFIELQRPSDGARSEPKDFTYTPSKVSHSRKRPRFTSSSYSSSNFSSGELPVTLNHFGNNVNECTYPKAIANIEPYPIVNNDELDEALKRSDVNSAEFDKLCSSLLRSEPMENLYVDQLTEADIRDLQMDAPQVDRKPAMVDYRTANLKSTQFSCALRKLTVGEIEIIKKFQSELVAFVKTRPPAKRMSKMLETSLADPNYITENEETILHLLISENNQEFLSFLLNMLFKHQQFDLINMKNKKGQTPLHLAVECHNLLVVRYLIHLKADLKLQDLGGNTVLHTAILANAPIVILKFILHFDVAECINTVNYDGLTALHLAVKSNNLSATKVLCWKNAEVNAEDKKSGDTPLHMAVTDQRVDIIRFLLDLPEIDIERENYAQHSPLKLAKVLVEKENPVTKLIYELFEVYMKKKGFFEEEITIKEEEVEDMSDEEMEVSMPEVKQEPDDLREKYSRVKTFTEECLNEVSALLDKSGTWHNLAELIDYGHLVRNNIFTSSRSLLQFAMKKAEHISLYEIRNFLDNLDESKAVECIDNMVNEMAF